MGRYDSHKNPFQYRMNAWSNRQINSGREQEAKSMPCHVTKIEKDFVHIAFETKNSIFTPPVMKMTQSFSRFGREATQVKDKGMAVPGDYYLGGNTAFAGGATNFYPRGNLSTLSFQPLSNLKAPKRDYDQHWETGGPNGWRVKVQEDQQQQQQQGQQGGNGAGGTGGGGTSAATARARQRVLQQRTPIPLLVSGPRFITPAAVTSGGGANGSSGGGQQQQQKQKDYTEFSFDKDGRIIGQSKDRKHYIKIDQKNKKVYLAGEGDSTFFGKKNAYVNSGSQVVLNPGAKGEESGAGWDSESGKDGGGGDSGGGGATQFSGGGGGGGKVYLGGDPQKDRFCLVQTVCGPSKNVFAKI